MGHSLLSQFPHLDFTYLNRPYVNTPYKAKELVKEISQVSKQQGFKPLVFATMPELDVNSIKTYDARIDALNYTLKHDDAMSLKTLDEADVIIVGVSRSGKTPTSLYLALKYGVKAANYPITDSDFDKHELPDVLLSNSDKLFATTIEAKRLREIREKRRPASEYAALATCKSEIKKAQQLYDKYGLYPMDVTHQSIEELSTQIIRKLKKEHSITIQTSKDL